MLPLLFAMTLSPAVPPQQPDAARLLRMLERLPEGARVLYVAAHPDDENTRLISWLVQMKKMRVAYLSITRGDGGQNLIGKEQGPALGLLRTQELLAARRLDLAEQFFTRARDFGYSKSAEETLRIWGHDRILADVVQVYRSFRPDVIVTRFSPQTAETHGHHTASAQLALEAFAKAAEPSFAKEQGLAPWKARRIVWNAFPPSPNADMSRFVQMDANAYDPLLGLSMGELAGDSRTMHKSQGFGAARSVLPAIEYFELLAGEPMQGSFLDGVPENVAQGALAKAISAYRIDAPQLAIPALLEAYAASSREEIAQAVVACAGIFLQAVSEAQTVTPGTPMPVTISAVPRNAKDLQLLSVRIGAKEIKGPGALGGKWIEKVSLEDLPPALASDPPWLRRAPEEGHYDVEPLAERIRPEPDAPLAAEFLLRSGEQNFTVRRPIVYRFVDPVLGDRTKAVEIAPPATIDAAPLLIFPDAAARPLRLTVRASAGPVQGAVVLEAPAGFSIEPHSQPFQLQASGEEAEMAFLVKPSARSGQAELALRVRVGEAMYDRSLRRIEYAHVPPQVWHPQARVKLVRVEVRRGSAKTVGYVAGAGDEVAPVLAQLGYQIIPLDEAALRERDLSSLDAVVLGVRAFNVHPWLAALKAKLHAYVERGGVLVVQYNTKNFLSRLPEPLGPWPMSISQERVTDETAQVTLGEDPALRGPNRISTEDFAGWIQERGLYFADKWDEKYSAPLSMHDPGEKPLRGSLLIGRHGKGRFVYTGLAFFRELPAGVPGAMRLFANLLARDADAL